MVQRPMCAEKIGLQGNWAVTFFEVVGVSGGLDYKPNQPCSSYGTQVMIFSLSWDDIFK